MNRPQVKICGITDVESLHAAGAAGADFVGLVFHAGSPRALDAAGAADLSRDAPEALRLVGLFVDPDDHDIEQILAHVRLDMIQLHGSESPGRVAAIRRLSGVAVMKAIALETERDLDQIAVYRDVCDWLLFDAKAASGGLPGGTGRWFNWDLLKGFDPGRPWMLAGGLNAGNIADALSILTPDAVDVSSGVEAGRGVKDPGKIRAFLRAVDEA